MTDRTFLLVPGAGGVAAYWSLVQRRLSEEGIESVAVDLPGDDPRAGLPEYVDLIIDAANGRNRVVVVGQSLGGFSASWAAARIDAKALVFVNAMIPVYGETAGDWWANTGQDQARRIHDARQGRDPDAPFDVETYFLHDVPAESLALLQHDVRDETDTVFEAPWACEARPDIPTFVVVGRDDRFFPAGFQTRVARERLGLGTTELPGGHLMALSYPDALVEALLTVS